MASKKEVEEVEDKRPAQDYIRAAAYFGVMPEIMTGALYGVAGNLTPEEVKEKVKKFCTTPVKGKKGD